MPKVNPTAAALLGLLLEAGPTTGAELARQAQVRIGGYWNITRSQVYRELKGLAVQGLVEAGEPGPRDAQPYALTAAGEAEFRQWLRAFAPRSSIRIGLLLLLTFGRHVPAEHLTESLERYGAAHRERLAEYEALAGDLEAGGVDAYVRATLSFGVHYERAVLAWLEEVASILPGEGRAVGAERPSDARVREA